MDDTVFSSDGVKICLIDFAEQTGITKEQAAKVLDLINRHYYLMDRPQICR